MPFLSTLSLRRATAAEHRLLALNSISIHALLAESDKPDKKAGSQEKDFYPRSPCGERPSCFSLWFLGLFISIHALLAESDSLYMDSVPPASRFLSTLSLRRATRLFLEIYTLFKNFYPRSPCGERLWVLRKVPILSIFLSTLSLRRATYQDKFSIPSDNISIHALLAESDGTGFFVLDERHDISIHALLAESDTPTLESLTPTQTFLSTLSLRRATRPVSALYSVNRYFYPRSPCGERPHPITILVRVVEISIHALLAESDAKNTSIAGRITSFLSTLSLRRATIQGISTSRKNTYFYPRSPCGERRTQSASLSL